jgi:molecular chaperone GrpE (heat shock protein)
MKKLNTIKPVIKSGEKSMSPRVAVKSVVKTGASKSVVKPELKKSPPKTAGKPRNAKAVKAGSTPCLSTPNSGIEALCQEITALRTQFARQIAPVTNGSMEEVDALRRVLNDLMEARMNDVIRELVTIRNSAASAGGEARGIAEQMDALLSDLGAMKFAAERLEHVDPLIHSVSREVTDTSLPDGVIMETLRPGFHTSRGIIVAKALVSINRRI